MRLRAGQARAQFALFACFCTARRTANGQRELLFDFHALHNGPLLLNKMVNSEQFQISFR